MLDLWNIRSPSVEQHFLIKSSKENQTQNLWIADRFMGHVLQQDDVYWTSSVTLLSGFLSELHILPVSRPSQQVREETAELVDAVLKGIRKSQRLKVSFRRK
ncbi:hypothetical protein CHARACLAT_027108 [Characodon lateralis]|uniref:Uncharacterized protein n=1 Tax=Characodon lateralis TaxID=208331 RepID=A0ABU7EF32_9TELE|nr:hypothetical protein [Characodon lateralis]